MSSETFASSAHQGEIAWQAGRAEVLYARFKRLIIDQQWAPGVTLNIGGLAAEHNVSITPVREALARLVADKLVVAIPNRGFRVAPAPSREQFAQLAEVRLLLEPAAARGATSRISPNDERELRGVHAEIARLHPGRDYSDIQGFSTLNRSFHQKIFDINANTVLAELYAQLGYHVAIGHFYRAKGIRDLPEVLAEHAAILTALRRRDPDAAEAAMREHVAGGARRLIEAYDGLRDAAPPKRRTKGKK